MPQKGMVDITQKTKTLRRAKAQARVRLPKEIIKKIKADKIPKGDVLEIARIAGILAAKDTYRCIPLCHNIELDYIDVEFIFEKEAILVVSTVCAFSKTGVEMEALSSVSAACLTIYDMCKVFSKSIEITDIYLLEKRGGKSGDYKR